MRTYLLHSFAACFMLLSTGYISAQVTYEQDFTEDPNFTSYHEEAEWLASEGTYRVNTFDNLDAKYWAHSPQFENTSISKDFSVSFDMMTENGVFGTYPSITFQSYDPEEISNAGESFRIAFFWSSTISRKFRFLTRDGDNQTWGMESVTSYADDTWYRFQIDYNSMDSTANIVIKDRATDAVLETLNDIQWHIQDVSYVCVGYYNQPNFGNDWSPIQIDNVVITQASMLTEICDNGIDDDGDGLIDLNDEDCDCESGNETLEVTTQGEPCDEDLILAASSEVEGDIQWYKDGIAIIGATDISYSIPFDTDRVGEYSYVVSNSEGCYAGEAYQIIPDDLIGSEQVLETTLCPGEAVIVNGETYTEVGTYEQVIDNAAGCESKVIINISAETACTDCNPSEQNKLTIPTKKLTDDQYMIELSGETYTLSEWYLAALLNHVSAQSDPNTQSLIHYIQQIEEKQAFESSTQPTLSDTYQFVRQVRVGAWINLEVRGEND